ncbi:pre-rRNA processing protein [Niveomyces insectorum RCEF 264]|uniref:Multiple RNA-binding domain-containing protein 1 n=1 Tax=Niveomyces insectorum RCEF 264 TaxID=1081102 RepID=A0A167N1D0_9HYPO|nr:pre-rRNA processing protein [Niveomyces insectorum RCEF 264]
MASTATTSDVPATEDSSRLFVKNLPPNITEDQLRKHFSGGGRHITDIKLIARRRIAFVGYRTPDEAAGAVRYFHRSYIRMSKLAVELAKSIGDPSLPAASKMQRLHEVHQPAVSVSMSAASVPPQPPSQQQKDASEPSAKKRKRDGEELDAAKNPKLREFLDVMQTQNRGLSSTADIFAGMGADGPGADGEDEEEDAAAAAAALAAAARNEAESDDEYEVLPAHRTKKAKPSPEEDGAKEEEKALRPAGGVDAVVDDVPERRKPGKVAVISATAIEEAADPSLSAAPAPARPLLSAAPARTADVAATDDDWLRSRTNRLLDLMDPSELPPPPNGVQASVPRPAETTTATATHNDEKDEIMNDVDETNDANDTNENTTDPPASGSKAASASAATADGAAAAAAAAASSPTPLSPEEQILKTSRLFVRNLPYDATEANIRDYFSAFGVVEEVQLPVTNTGANKGYAMVLFADPAVALAAFHNADGKTFQGRILHVLPAKAKRAAAELDEFALAKLPLKQQKLLRKKAEAATSSFAWNALFMSQDAVNAAVADRLGVSKSALLDPTSADEAVRQAVRQTSMIEETKDYFEANGVDLEAFKPHTKRGDTCILVKNFAYGTAPEELRKMFEEYGPVVRVLMPPSGTLAIVQFAQPVHGRLAYSKMAYRRVNDTVLLLEKCPDNVLSSGGGDSVAAAPAASRARDKQTAGGKTKLAASDLLAGDNAGDDAEADADGAAADTAATTSSLFVRNLNFTTTTEQLAAAFAALDGFVAARRAADADAKRAANRGSKLIIKNVPFEASRQDLRTLLGTYGQLRAVRMPKKFGNATRGYAFAEFTTAREAAAAMAALRNTHLLGRRLVLDFASAEAVDAEEAIAQMQKKTGAQMHSVALQQLTTGRRQRTKVHISEADEADDGA